MYIRLEYTISGGAIGVDKNHVMVKKVLSIYSIFVGLSLVYVLIVFDINSSSLLGSANMVQRFKIAIVYIVHTYIFIVESCT